MAIDVVASHSSACCAWSNVVAAYVCRPVPVLADFPLLRRWSSAAKQWSNVDELSLVLSVCVMTQQHIIFISIWRYFCDALSGLSVPSVYLDDAVILLLYWLWRAWVVCVNWYCSAWLDFQAGIAYLIVVSYKHINSIRQHTIWLERTSQVLCRSVKVVDLKLTIWVSWYWLLASCSFRVNSGVLHVNWQVGVLNLNVIVYNTWLLVPYYKLVSFRQPSCGLVNWENEIAWLVKVV